MYINIYNGKKNLSYKWGVAKTGEWIEMIKRRRTEGAGGAGEIGCVTSDWECD